MRSIATNTPVSFESLENRWLMSGTPAVINGTDAADVIDIRYVHLDHAHTWLWSVNGQSFQAYNGNFGSVTINGRGGDDRITFSRTYDTSIIINGGDGNDAIHLGLHAYSTEINSGATIDGGGGTDSLFIHDEEGSTPQFQDRYVVTSTSVKWGGINQGGALFYNNPTTFAGVEGLRLNCNPGGSYIEVAGIHSAMDVSIIGGSGAETIDLTPSSGDLDSNILGSLTMNATGGTDKVSFFDHNDSFADTYNLTANSLSKSGVKPISLFGFEQATLWGNHDANTYDVQGVHQNYTKFEIKDTGGNDKFIVGGGNLVNAMRGKLAITGGAGDDTLEIRDNASSDTSYYALTDASLSRTNFSSTKLSWDAMQKITLKAGTGANTISVRPSLTSEFIMRGGQPNSAPGDALFLDLNGATDTTLNTIPLGGRVYQFSNRRKISFYEMESYQSAPAELEATVSPALLGIVKLESIAQQIFRDG